MTNIPNSKSNLEYYIVPWALPREDIPIRVEIPKNIFFDKIRIRIPNDFEFKDFLNIAKVTVTENIAEIDKLIKTKSDQTPIYFGFVVSSIDIPPTLKTSKKILIELLSNNEVIGHEKLSAHIFRPKLEVTDINERIILTDDVKEYEMPMDIKYIGFGDIKLRIEGRIEDTIEGQIVSEEESIVNELLRRLLTDSQSESNTKIPNDNKVLHFEDSSLIPNIIMKMEKKIKKGDISGLGEFSEEDLKSFEELCSDPETKNNFLNIVYTRVEDIFISLLSELFETNPMDNVKLTNSQTNIKVKINSHITSILTRLLYEDSIGNKYPPVEIPIKIVDNREDRSQTNINMPVSIKNWEEEPFMNVAEMNMEED